MMRARERLFGLVKFWTITTTVFAWLPLVRILGKPEGYQWGLFGLRGSGTDGPYWIFIVLTLYALTMLFTGSRGPRWVFYPLLLLWHLALTGAVVIGSVLGGGGAAWEGQGLHFSFPLAAVAIPFVLFTGATIVWTILDIRLGGAPAPAPWTATNTRKLLIGLTLLPLALLLFRAGTNYDWVTASAIIVAVSHWILLAISFEPAPVRRAAH